MHFASLIKIISYENISNLPLILCFFLYITITITITNKQKN